jgi:hypothetical protein
MTRWGGSEFYVPKGVLSTGAALVGRTFAVRVHLASEPLEERLTGRTGTALRSVVREISAAIRALMFLPTSLRWWMSLCDPGPAAFCVGRRAVATLGLLDDLVTSLGLAVSR